MAIPVPPKKAARPAIHTRACEIDSSAFAVAPGAKSDLNRIPAFDREPKEKIITKNTTKKARRWFLRSSSPMPLGATKQAKLLTKLSGVRNRTGTGCETTINRRSFQLGNFPS